MASCAGRHDDATDVCVSGGKKHSFFGKFGVLGFLETLVLRFDLLPYYRRLKVIKFAINMKIKRLRNTKGWLMKSDFVTDI